MLDAGETRSTLEWLTDSMPVRIHLWSEYGDSLVFRLSRLDFSMWQRNTMICLLGKEEAACLGGTQRALCHRHGR